MADEKKNAPRETPLRLFGLTQYLTDPAYWPGWSGDELALLDGPAGPLVARLVERLEAGGCEVEAAYGIIHDRDEHEVWDEVRKALVTETKPRHLHAVIRFAGRDGGATLRGLSAMLGVEAQYLEKPGRGRWAADNMLSYLTHIKYADKYQYDAADVATVRGADYEGIYAARREAWLKGRATVARKSAEADFDDLWEKCFSGEITRAEIDFREDYRRCYAQNQPKIDAALQSYADKRARIAAEKIRRGEFSTAIFFVTGRSGAGKSHVGHAIASKLVDQAAGEGQRWGVYEAATGNPLDDWRGEEVLFLNDLRADAMSATDWLLLLDPANASPASARYRNKQNVAPRAIIITAVLSPYEFFSRVRNKGGESEVIDQFIRRLTSIIHPIQTGDAELYGGRAYVVQPVGPQEGHVILPPIRAYERERMVPVRFGPVDSRVLGFDDLVRAAVVTAWSRYHDMAAMEPVDLTEHQQITGVPLRALTAGDLAATDEVVGQRQAFSVWAGDGEGAERPWLQEAPRAS